MAINIAINVEKGGSGKTTLGINLAYWLSKMGYRVLYCDNDSSSNATSILLNDEFDFIKAGEKFREVRHGKVATDTDSIIEVLEALKSVMPKVDLKKDIHDVLEDRIPIWEAIQPTKYDNLSILGSTSALSGTDTVLKGNLNPFKLRDALVSVDKEFDFILIDNQAFENALTISSISACYRPNDVVLIPVKIDSGGIEGLYTTGLNAAKFTKAFNLQCQIKFVVNMKNRTKADSFWIECLKEALGDTMLDTVIRYQAAPVVSSSLNRKIVSETKKNVSNDYQNLAKELVHKLNI